MLRFMSRQVRTFLGDPRWILGRWRAIPYFIANLCRYVRRNREKGFAIRVRGIHFASSDCFAQAATLDGQSQHIANGGGSHAVHQ